MGGGAEPADARTVAELEQRCEDELRQIDDAERELRRYAAQLASDAHSVGDARREADRVLIDTERRKADQEWFINALQQELDRLERELREKDRLGAELDTTRQQQVLSEQTAMDYIAGGEAPDSGAASQCAGGDIARVLRTREGKLRELEDRELKAEDRVRSNQHSQRALDADRDQLKLDAASYFARVEQDMTTSQAIAEQLRRDGGALTARRKELEQRNRRLSAEQASLREREQALRGEEAALKEELREVTRGRDDAARNLAATTLPPDGSKEQLYRLEETMMLLKGHAINLGDDCAFVGDVFRCFAGSGDPYLSAQPMEAFCTAFDHIQEYVWAAHGRQRPGERWQLSFGREPRHDEVERVLSALKQLVSTFDMMDAGTKLRVPCAGDVIRNSSHLIRAVQEHSARFAETLEARAHRRAEEAADAERRVRQGLARARERDRRRLRQYDAPPAERYAPPPRPLSSAPPQRPPSPQLRPLTAGASRGGAGPPAAPPPLPAGAGDGPV